MKRSCALARMGAACCGVTPTDQRDTHGPSHTLAWSPGRLGGRAHHHGGCILRRSGPFAGEDFFNACASARASISLDRHRSRSEWGEDRLEPILASSPSVLPAPLPPPL